MPTRCASGPTVANPIGMNTSDTSQSYELTRDSRSRATRACSSVAQIVLPTTIDTKASSDVNASASVGSGTA